jgi:hypothetical protein
MRIKICRVGVYWEPRFGGRGKTTETTTRMNSALQTREEATIIAENAGKATCEEYGVEMRRWWVENGQRSWLEEWCIMLISGAGTANPPRWESIRLEL